MALQEDDGVDFGPQQDIDRARTQLWYAKMEGSGAVGRRAGTSSIRSGRRGASTS